MFDIHEYLIIFNPFRIIYTINGSFVMEVNHKDLLYFESDESIHEIKVCCIILHHIFNRIMMR